MKKMKKYVLTWYSKDKDDGSMVLVQVGTATNKRLESFTDEEFTQLCDQVAEKYNVEPPILVNVQRIGRGA